MRSASAASRNSRPSAVKGRPPFGLDPASRMPAPSDVTDRFPRHPSSRRHSRRKIVPLGAWMLNVATRSRACSEVRLPHFNSVGRDTGTVAYSAPMASSAFPIPAGQGRGHGGNALPAASASASDTRRRWRGRASERGSRSTRADDQPWELIAPPRHGADWSSFNIQPIQWVRRDARGPGTSGFPLSRE